MTTLPASADPAALRPSATIVLLRDGPNGLEVLLLRRSDQSRVMGGVYVFPGGKLDADDCAPHWHPLLDQPAPQLHQRLGETGLPPDTAQGLFVAALRETFEEAGVLLAHSATGQALPSAPALRTTLQQGTPWPEALRQHGLRWHTDAIQPWTRWITPVQTSQPGSPRFDTRFFVARLPEGQQAEHDAHEAVASVWLPPREALERYWAGDLSLLPPQLLTLAHLSHHASTASLWQDIQQRPATYILPEAASEEGVHHIRYPGDPRHSVSTPVLRGPKVLRYVNRRFEPAQGFEGWFA